MWDINMGIDGVPPEICPVWGGDTVAYRYVASDATIVLRPIEASLVRDGGGVLIFYVCEVQSAKAAP